MAAAAIILDVGPRAVKLTFGRGDTPIFGFYLTDEDGAAIDISGRTYIFTADSRQNPDNATTNLFAITGNVPTGMDGLVTFQPAGGDLDLDPNAAYYFDVQQTNGTDIRTIIKGTIAIVQDITK